MDLRNFYAQIREAEAKISGDFAVITSLDTPDGGKAGVVSEVQRSMAAKLFVERRARLASVEETDRYHAQMAAIRERVANPDSLKGMQVAVITQAELNQIRGRKPGSKE